ncbi:MAG: class I SAM-dependent methyltransferase [Candidatus Pseudobacter hemicellulosilyticus]|uniref:Class I SAM-dependent methyltransferase n=1 Tax=Candidatus Pseudobacter hemicellulosilyticus TaxID=3121375 RepID=A0AAJ5WVL2_9BACT|nr:MAG: class I SAM-dependent methyltransferase [Pseudobacter sp.]
MSHPSIVQYTVCPACQSNSIQPVLTVKDYTVSQENFEIWECDQCTLRFTQAVPDEGAIGRYYQAEDYISHTNTNKGLVNRLYHTVRSITLKNKRKLIKQVSGRNTGQLLDVGAGAGAFAAFMQRSGWQVIGLEPDPDTRQRAREQYGLNLHETSELFRLPEGHFDVITLWHVLEHVHSLHEYLRQLKLLLKPGGTLLIAVPNYTSGDATHYGAFWAAYDVPRHLYHFSPLSMRRLLQGHGLQLKGIRPMWFDSFYVSMMSEKYKTGNSSLLKGAWQGLVSNNQAMTDKERCSSLIYVVSC